jgi:hypothetical protein
MLEVELTSELMIAQIDGMQDKKKSIDQFYRKYDDIYIDRDLHEARFRSVIDSINDAFDNSLGETEFSRVPLFYSLYCAIYHYQNGLPNLDLPTPRRELSKAKRLGLVEAVQNLSDLIESGRGGEPMDGQAGEFVDACLRQTDNIKPRQDRLRYLYNQAFSE